MKSTFIFALLLLFIGGISFAQNAKDTLAEINKKYNFHHIYITPNEQIIVKSDGKSFIKSSETTPFRSYNNSIYDSLGYFYKYINKDIVLAFGEYTSDPYIYSRSENGGKSFSQLTFDSTQISCIYSDKTYNTWISGYNGAIYESANLGKSWKKTPIISHIDADIKGIAMSNINTGILYTDDNCLYITNNDWKNLIKIKTPAQQLSMNDSFVHEIFCWKDYFIVKQNEQYYYTKKSKIDWKKFKDEFRFITHDNQSDKLFGLSKNNEFVYVPSPEKIEIQNKIGEITPGYSGIQPQVVNEKLYVLSYDNYPVILRASKNKIDSIFITTDEFKIEKPEKVVKIKNKYYGITDNALYRSNDGTHNWDRIYRFKIFTDKILSVKNDSILYISSFPNYEFNINSKAFFKIKTIHPFTNFLKYNIKTFKFESIAGGCFRNVSNILEYISSTNNKLICNSNAKFGMDKTEIQGFKNTTETQKLVSLLQEINSNPEQVPNLKEFNLTGAQIQQLNFNPDTLSRKSIQSIIDKRFGGSTNYFEFIITITNTNNDTISFYSYNSGNDPRPWKMPMVCSCGNYKFNSYNYRLPNLIKQLIPKEFIGYTDLNNDVLIEHINKYFKK